MAFLQQTLLHALPFHQLQIFELITPAYFQHINKHIIISPFLYSITLLFSSEFLSLHAQIPSIPLFITQLHVLLHAQLPSFALY